MSKIHSRLILGSLTLVLILGLTFAYQNGKSLNTGQVLGINTNDLNEIENNRQYTNISPNQALDKLQKEPQIILLDVRTQTEREETGYLKNSENIDYYDPQFDTKIQALDKTQTYIIYDRSGQRSQRTAQIMSEKGFENIYNLAGGINAWQVAGFEVVK
jgi:phage shock protein E